MKMDGRNNLAALIQSVLAEFRYGAAWKLVSLAARAGFLFVVCPSLPDGELGRFVFFSTTALMASRLMAVGLEDELPLYVKGKREVAQAWVPLYSGVALLALVAALFYVLSGELIFAVACLSLGYGAHSLLGGLVRSVDVRSYELLANCHWPVFFLMALWPTQWQADRLLILMWASLLFAQIIAVRKAALALRIGYRRLSDGARQLWPAIRAGRFKLASNLAMLGSMRALIVWPTLFKKTDGLDAIAFALSLGEAVWQLGMVLVNRRYARYCRQAGDRERNKRDSILVSWILLAVFAVLSLVIMLATPWLPDVIEDGRLVGMFIVFFGMMAGQNLLRYYVWSTGIFGWILFSLLVLQFLLIGLIVLSLDQILWLPLALGVALAAFVAVQLRVKYSH